MPPSEVPKAPWQGWSERNREILRQYREYQARTYPIRLAREQEARDQALVRRTAEMMAKNYLEENPVQFRNGLCAKDRIKAAGERAVLHRNAKVLESTPPMQVFSSMPAVYMFGVTDRSMRYAFKNGRGAGCGCIRCRPGMVPSK